jgi:ketosteroid isomerase-like protein
MPSYALAREDQHKQDSGGGARGWCGMTSMMERLLEAMNAHDLDRMTALFAEDYASSQPMHPNRVFVGRAQVLQNWTSVFEGVPEFTAELTASAADGDVEWGEWYWRGRHVDGSPFTMTGVTIFVIRDDVIAEGRLYMEPIDADSGDIDAAVQELYRPPPAEVP